MKKLSIIATGMILGTSSLKAMDPAIFLSAQVIASIASHIQASRTPTPQPNIYINGPQMLYIGKCETRDTLERIYGKKFPINTAFVNIGFEGVSPQELPQLIPYDLIYEHNQGREIEEGDTLKLTINGKEMQVVCKQRNAPYAPKQKFEYATASLANRFLHSPHWLCENESEESLIQAGVILAEMRVQK